MTVSANKAFKAVLEDAASKEVASVVLNALEQEASVSIRLNPQAITPGMEARDFAAGLFGMEVEPVQWNKYGFMLAERPSFTLDPHFHSGTYYVQDSSSMFVGRVFREIAKPAEGQMFRVLDLCAAPGGKTTDLAASLREICGENFLLVSNEVMRQRASILADNAAIWGDPNVVVTSCDPKAFSSLEGFFDIILTDVPCSGEGMFRKDEEALRQWSEENVALCEARSRRIVADVWPALREGGTLIYSTCTFNRRENDGNAEWIGANLGGDILTDNDICPHEGVYKTLHGYSLFPGFVKGEGQYCCAIRKTSECGAYRMKKDHQKPVGGVPESIRKMFRNEVVFRLKGTLLIALPRVIAEEENALSQLHPSLSGTAVGEIKGKDLVPNADLSHCMNLDKDAFTTYEADLKQALMFLHRDAIILQDAPKGLVLLKYQGRPLGFVKNLGNRCNNLHPLSRRILMNIDSFK